MSYEMSAVSDNEVRAEREANMGSPVLLAEQLRAFNELLGRQSRAVLGVEQALGGRGWHRFLSWPRSPLQRAARAARELEELHGLVLEAAARLSRIALSESGETPAVVGVTAAEHDGMRRQLEHPDSEQQERVRQFVSRTPSPPRA